MNENLLSLLLTLPIDHLRVVLRDPSYTKDGVLYLIDDAESAGKVPWFTPATCEHEHTACLDCLDTWWNDHVIVVVTDKGDRFDLDNIVES